MTPEGVQRVGGVVDAARRLGFLTFLAARETATLLRSADAVDGAQGRAENLAAAMGWLCLTHDVTGRRGSSKGFSLVRGWLPAYPETTGYIIGTLLAYSRVSGDDSLVERAVEMGDWELEVQAPDGGIRQGVVTETRTKSIAFDTGMVIHGWLDLHELDGRVEYLEAASRAGQFLVSRQSEDGAWRGDCSYMGIPHTYHSRVSWALLRLGEATGERRFVTAALKNLRWVTSMQQSNGWFESSEFVPGRLPNTHGIAYTLRGLLESHALTGCDDHLEAARRTADALCGKMEELGTLPATFDRSWQPVARHVCLTGLAQLGGVWLRLFQLTGDARLRAAGIRAVDQAAGHQQRVRWRPIRGALAGSFPIYGRYAPLQFPNWATKFLADALMLQAECLPPRSEG